MVGEVEQYADNSLGNDTVEFGAALGKNTSERYAVYKTPLDREVVASEGV